MIMEIGFVAGDILHQLESSARLTLNQLVERTGKPRHLILMGMGWLGREGHISIEGDLENCSVTLKHRHH